MSSFYSDEDRTRGEITLPDLLEAALTAKAEFTTRLEAVRAQKATEIAAFIASHTKKVWFFWSRPYTESEAIKELRGDSFFSTWDLDDRERSLVWRLERVGEIERQAGSSKLRMMSISERDINLLREWL